MSGTYLEVGGSSSGNGGGGGSPYWKDAVADFASLPPGSVIGEARLAQDTQIIYIWDGLAWSEEDITKVPSSRTISTTAPLTGGGDLSANRTLSMPASTNSVDGYLSAADHTSFAAKVDRAGDTMSGLLKADGGIDVTATGGTDTLSIGTANADIINIGRSSATVNVQGTTAFQNVTNYNVADKNITINSGGSAGSASGAGLDVEENAIITGYSRTSGDRNSWEMKAPNTAGIATVTPGAGGITINQSSHNPVTIGTANGLSLSTQQLSLATSSGSTTGALTSTDWNTFNNKEPAVTAGTATQYYRGDKTFQELNSDALTTIVDGSSPAVGKLFREFYNLNSTLAITNVASTGAWGYAHSATIPAGRWYLGGILYVNDNSAVVSAGIAGAIGLTANPVSISIGSYVQMAYLISGGTTFSLMIPYRLYSFASPTTLYLNSQFTYSSGTPQHCGAIMGWMV